MAKLTQSERMELVLERAWQDRAANPRFLEEPIRILYGEGEAWGTELQGVAIDIFPNEAGKKELFAWVTLWEKISSEVQKKIADFLQRQGIAAAAVLVRPEQSLPEPPVALWGELPEDFVTVELGIRYGIRFKAVRHPGLFLDHRPLRRWLSMHSKGQRILNTFAYTGSLSLACAQGQAAETCTVDLSKPTIEWAKANFALNGKTAGTHRFYAQDTFDFFKIAQKKGEQFDIVVLDPPSFSRTKTRAFSTQKDLPELHEGAMRLLVKGGLLVTSVNNSKLPNELYEKAIQEAAKKTGRKFLHLKTIEQPPTFPSVFGVKEQRYLKGWVLRCQG